jgi:hypothetical protein
LVHVFVNDTRLGQGAVSLRYSSLGKGKRIGDIDTQMADGILNVWVPKQNFDSIQIASDLVYEWSLGWSHLVRPIFARIKTDNSHPFINQTGVLACAQMAHVVDAAWRDVVFVSPAAPFEPSQQCPARFGHQLELLWPANFLSNDRLTVLDDAGGDDVANLDLDDTKRQQLAVNYQV